MAGIYIHIPFCKKACHYCNFHFSTSLGAIEEITNAIVKELRDRYNYLEAKVIDTIYFGGGTPSVISPEKLSLIIQTIEELFEVSNSAEITLEANPDDLTNENLHGFKSVGINRLSIGIQSFSDKELEFMNRSHNADQAMSSLLEAKKLFSNISADLIFGGQYTDERIYENNIKQLIDLQLPHLSCYSLTIEEHTVFGNWLTKNKLQSIDDSIQQQQFLYTLDTLTTSGYLHYEISNYALPNHLAVHNTNYWKEKHYLGVGPSAHSYNGDSRQWNIANNNTYLKNINSDKSYSQSEALSTTDKYNEYILTGLRTMWGCDIKRIESFGDHYHNHMERQVSPIIEKNLINIIDNHLILTNDGKLFADKITQELFYLAEQ